MRILLRSALLLAFLAGVSPAWSAPLPPPRIAIVDLQELSRSSKATAELDRKVNAAKQAFRENAKFKYEKIQEELRAFRVDSASMPQAERAERQSSLEQRIAGLTEEEKSAMAKIEARGQATMAALQGKLTGIVKTIADGLTVDLVLEKQSYDKLVADKMMAAGANDITGLVLVFLNDQIPTVELAPEGAAP